MKKRFHTLLAMVLLSASFTACVGDSDDDTESLSSDCYISSFTLGTMRRVLHTTGSDGQDSTYTLTYSGSYYPLSIDQRNGTITNVEPLPYGTVRGNALATISAQGSVIYTHEANLSDTTAWTPYASSDSIDFSEPLLFRVYAYDGSGYRQYRVTLNVRENEKGSYSWQHISDLAFADTRIAAKLVLQSGQPLVGSQTTQGQLFVMPFGQDEQVCSGLPGTTEVQTMSSFDGKLWLSSRDGLLFQSDDGIAWQEVAQNSGAIGVELVAASETALYAIVFDHRVPGGGFLPYAAASTDGHTWTATAVDESLFTSHNAALAYTQTNGNRRVLVAAPADESDANYLCTWSLLESPGQRWTLFTDPANPYPLPALTQLSLVSYNGLLMAFGGQTQDGTHSALDATYVSYDNGITWKTSAGLVPPTELQGAEGVIAAAADDNNIWLLAAGQLWQAQQNP